jgi:hypothetical protein
MAALLREIVGFRVAVRNGTFCDRPLADHKVEAVSLPARQSGVSTPNKSRLVVAKKHRLFPLFVWSRLRIHQMPTVMVDIKPVVGQGGASGERVRGAEPDGPGKNGHKRSLLVDGRGVPRSFVACVANAGDRDRIGDIQLGIT